MAENNAENTEVTNQTPQRQFAIRSLYVRDISFETTRSFDVYNKKVSPQVDTDMSSESRRLSDTEFEVTLSITATIKLEAETILVVEVHQSGIFSIVEPEKPQMHYLLNCLCPSILFPYTRELISNLMSRGGFQPFYLAPVNFDVLYMQQMQQAQQQAAAPDA